MKTSLLFGLFVGLISLNSFAIDCRYTNPTDEKANETISFEGCAEEYCVREVLCDEGKPGQFLKALVCKVKSKSGRKFCPDAMDCLVESTRIVSQVNVEKEAESPKPRRAEPPANQGGATAR